MSIPAVQGREKALAMFNRFPSLQDSIKVYSVIAMLIYAWSILRLFWELPSWLYYLTVPEIVPLFAYALVTNLLESLLVLAGLNLFFFVLPGKWFHESFVARASLFVSLVLGYLMYFASLFGKEGDYPEGLLLWSPGVLVASFLLSLVLVKITFVKKMLEALADRLTIFLYLIIPLSGISLLMVLIRNIW